MQTKTMIQILLLMQQSTIAILLNNSSNSSNNSKYLANNKYKLNQTIKILLIKMQM